MKLLLLLFLISFNTFSQKLPISEINKYVEEEQEIAYSNDNHFILYGYNKDGVKLLLTKIAFDDIKDMQIVIENGTVSVDLFCKNGDDCCGMYIGDTVYLDSFYIPAIDYEAAEKILELLSPFIKIKEENESNEFDIENIKIGMKKEEVISYFKNAGYNVELFSRSAQWESYTIETDEKIYFLNFKNGKLDTIH
ncbi:hypothetical protein [Galbibacter pacificus]|uniref:PepSY domain-containing protein n=1 Tax=Galbibacter pacificus TaxID=2996052 RepID=A0ABT6FQF0_9FLAO|nr:hypothetical protein [Galbibacter pacificus]MDG3582031.1 hypothetical protein [Galbibacter pacificus]MDG3585495.1 hypothetical protein [Galbibacter pacificus]